MIERRRGGVLNVGSLAGFLPGPGMAIYYASKAFVLSFTEALAEELAGTGVTVTALCPGPTATNFGNVSHGPKMRRLNTPKMPAAAVASYGHRAFRKGRWLAVPGWQSRFLVFLVRILPRWCVRKLAALFNRTEE
jgi:short-subunit dehydrogenase